MLASRALEPAGLPGPLPDVDALTRPKDAAVGEGGAKGSPKVQQSGSGATGTLGAMAEAGGNVMRSLAMDPVSATRQTLGAVRRHPYVTALLLLMFGAVIVGLARS
jgi:hypothetical protein